MLVYLLAICRPEEGNRPKDRGGIPPHPVATTVASALNEALKRVQGPRIKLCIRIMCLLHTYTHHTTNMLTQEAYTRIHHAKRVQEVGDGHDHWGGVPPYLVVSVSLIYM